MEEITEHLRDTGFLQPDSLDKNELENLLFKPSQDRIDLIKWCLSEVHEHLGTKLGNIQGDELKHQLLTLTRKLGLSAESDRDTVLGTGDQEQQIQFWLKLLKVVKCTQIRNKISTDERLKNTLNTSNFWYEHLQNPKFKESLNTKLNLIPTEWKIGAQQEHVSLASVVKDKDSLLQQLQAMKEESRDGVCDKNGLDMCDDVNNISAALKALTVNSAEKASRLELVCRDESLKSQPRRHQAQSTVATALEDSIPSVYGQVNALSQTLKATGTLVDGLEAAAGLQCENKLGEGGNVDLFNIEML